MQYITTTELRTKTRELIKTLSQGQSVILIHRSKVIAEIIPVQRVKPFNTKTFKA